MSKIWSGMIAVGGCTYGVNTRMVHLQFCGSIVLRTNLPRYVQIASLCGSSTPGQLLSIQPSELSVSRRAKMSKSDIAARLKANSVKSAFMTGSSPDLLSVVKSWHSTGCWPLDAIIGGGTDEHYGGIPSGRIIELFGDESTGKSLVALSIAAEFQRAGGDVLLMDVEATNTSEWMSQLGVDTDRLLVAYPRTIEAVFDVLVKFLETKWDIIEETGEYHPTLVIWDSIAATTAMAELDAVESDGLSKASIAPHARAMSKMLRIVPELIQRTNTTALFVNQTRSRIGVMFGNNVTTIGGKALKFHCSVRIQLEDVRRYKSPTKDVIGHEIRARVIKNKVDRPFRYCRFPVLFDGGINNSVACFWFLKQLGVIETTGSWSYMYVESTREKFQRKSWHGVFEKHAGVIRDIVMSHGEEYNHSTEDDIEPAADEE
jgi:recombination protein RecA